MMFSGLPRDRALRPMFGYVFRSRFHYWQALCFGLDSAFFNEDELQAIIRDACQAQAWARRHPESLPLLVDREQCTEIKYLQRFGLPFAIYILEDQQWLDGLSGEESESPSRPLLVRGAPSEVNRFRIQCPWTSLYNDQRSQEAVERWLSYFTRDLRHRYLQRRMCLTTFGELLALWPELSREYSIGDRVFVKSVRKQRNRFSFVCEACSAIDQPASGPWEWQGVLDADELCIISQPLDLADHSEYRCFVIDGQLSSVSRQFDFEMEPQEGTVTEFARQVVQDLGETGLVKSYVLDLAALPNGQLVVIELNEIGTSGRYVNNRVDWMVNQLYGCQQHWSWLQYSAFQAAVDAMGQLTPAIGLRDRAEQRLAEGSAMAAEAYFREYLALPGLRTFDFVGASLSLSQLLRNQTQNTEALQIAEASVVMARQSHSDEPDAALLVSMHEQARCLINLRDYRPALNVITEIHQQLAQWLAEDPFMSASLAVLAAECHVGLDDLELAEDELNKAQRHMEPFHLPAPSPSLSDLLADWWSVSARLLLARGNIAAARQAWQEVTQQREQCLELDNSAMSRMQLAEALADLQAVCRIFGDPAAAQQAEIKRQAILACLNSCAPALSN